MAAVSSKKFVNNPSQCVRESLLGFVQTNPNAILLDRHNVIVRKDIAALSAAGKVAVISGGGSGHEPAHVGYVGMGMLSAAVCGEVFTSPPAAAILACFRACQSPQGILAIVKNYTGDRINFGKAIELARLENIKAEMVIVEDDCALVNKERHAGRRGLCGTVLIHKLAGAMSEAGCPLPDMVTYLNNTMKNLGTISVSLSPCSLPGQCANFTVGSDEAEFGLGIHGEPGVKTLKMKPAADMVDLMLRHLDESRLTPFKAGSQIALVVNNLGATSNIELNVVVRDALRILNAKGISVARCYVGTFMTSLDMAGLSLTVLVVDDTSVLSRLDAPTDAPSWPRQSGLLAEEADLVMTSNDEVNVSGNAEVTEALTEQGHLVYACLDAVVSSLSSAEGELNELDRSAGDGDCGTTMARAATAIKSVMGSRDAPRLPYDSLGLLLRAVANVVENSAGGSSGALLGIMLLRISTRLRDGASFSCAFDDGVAALVKYGGAQPGDRTMIDALMPAVVVLRRTQQDGGIPASLSTSKDMAVAARKGAQETVSMTSHAGRSSYVSADKLTMPDPGATAVAIVLEAISNVCQSVTAPC